MDRAAFAARMIRNAERADKRGGWETTILNYARRLADQEPSA